MNSADHSARLNFHGDERAVAQGTATPVSPPQAVTEFYALYSRRLYRTIIAITKHSQDAEDALQDTFLRAYLSFHTFEGRSNVYSWLTRIAVNSALLVLRKRRARPEILFDPQPDVHADAFYLEIKDPAPSPERICDLRHRRVVLIRAIHNLEAKLQEPLRMRITNESSMKEISRALNISEAAVKTRLHRARLRLSAVYEES